MQIYVALLVIVSVLPISAQANSIVFPDRSKWTSKGAKFVTTEKPICAGALGFCDGDLQDYPSSEFIDESLKNSQLTPLGEVADPAEELVTRFDFGDDDGWIQETPACSSVERVLYPKQAETRDNKWLYVLNNDKVIQGIRVETCANEGGPGRVAPEATVCRQKYIYRRLLALNGSGGAAPDSFRIPSCCVCYVKADYLGHRFGPGTKLNASSTASPASTTTTTAPPTQLRSHSLSNSHSSSIQFGPSTRRRSNRPDPRSLPRNRRNADSQTMDEQPVPKQAISESSRGSFSTNEGSIVGEINVLSNPLVILPKRQKQVSP